MCEGGRYSISFQLLRSKVIILYLFYHTRKGIPTFQICHASHKLSGEILVWENNAFMNSFMQLSLQLIWFISASPATTHKEILDYETSSRTWTHDARYKLIFEVDAPQIKAAIFLYFLFAVAGSSSSSFWLHADENGFRERKLDIKVLASVTLHDIKPWILLHFYDLYFHCFRTG